MAHDPYPGIFIIQVYIHTYKYSLQAFQGFDGDGSGGGALPGLVGIYPCRPPPVPISNEARLPDTGVFLPRGRPPCGGNGLDGSEEAGDEVRIGANVRRGTLFVEVGKGFSVS